MGRRILTRKEVIEGKVCPYCGETPELTDSSEVYARSYGPIYLCRPCWAWVGVHKGTTRPLGRLANGELREWKKRAHRVFDPIAKTSLINTIWPKFIKGRSNRSKAYFWLSQQMHLPEEECHIGMMDVMQCQQVIEICQNANSICTTQS